MWALGTPDAASGAVDCAAPGRGANGLPRCGSPVGAVARSSSIGGLGQPLAYARGWGRSASIRRRFGISLELRGPGRPRKNVKRPAGPRGRQAL